MTHDTRSASQLATSNEEILHAEEFGLKDKLAPHLHEDFIIVRANGRKENRQEFLGAVPANARRGRTADVPDIRVYGDWAVIVIQVNTSENADGTEALRSFWNTRVFVQQDGEWQCVAWQVTEILDV